MRMQVVYSMQHATPFQGVSLPPCLCWLGSTMRTSLTCTHRHSGLQNQIQHIPTITIANPFPIVYALWLCDLETRTVRFVATAVLWEHNKILSYTLCQRNARTNRVCLRPWTRAPWFRRCVHSRTCTNLQYAHSHTHRRASHSGLPGGVIVGCRIAAFLNVRVKFHALSPFVYIMRHTPSAECVKYTWMIICLDVKWEIITVQYTHAQHCTHNFIRTHNPTIPYIYLVKLSAQRACISRQCRVVVVCAHEG